MGLNKKFIYIFVLCTLMIIIPKNTHAANAMGSSGAAASTYSMTEEEINNEISGIETTIHASEVGDYRVRYDVTHIGISADEKFQMQGWGVIKDYNNGVINSFAPTYYLKIIVDNGDGTPKTNYYYKFVADYNNSGIDFPELNTTKSGSYELGICGASSPRRSYKNAEFAFNDISLNDVIHGHSTTNLRIKFEMLIAVDGGSYYCSKVKTEWFDLGIYNYEIDGRSKIEKDASSKFSIHDIDQAKFVAGSAGLGTSVTLEGEGSETVKCDGNCPSGYFTQNKIYKITDFRKINNWNLPANGAFRDSDGHWSIKYAYYLDGTTDRGWAFSTWLQAKQPFELHYSPCDAFDNLSTSEKQVCCNSTWGESNASKCCEGGNNNTSLYNDTSTTSRICCDGAYGYEYAIKHRTEGTCCSAYPQMCCDNQTFINNNWSSFVGDRLWYKGVCCQTSGYYIEGTNSFPTFRTAGLTNQYNNRCTIEPLVCRDDEYLYTDEIPMLDINGNVTRQVELYIDSEIDITTISLRSATATVNVRINDDVQYNSRTNKLTFSYTVYSFDFRTTNLSLTFAICYDRPSSSGSSCDNRAYRNANPTICCNSGTTYSDLTCGTARTQPTTDSLSCDVSESTMTSNAYGVEISRTSSGLTGQNVVCYERIKFKNYKTRNELLSNIVYSGTGFSYDIDVEDTIICEGDYNNAYAYDGQNNYNIALNALNQTLNRSLNSYTTNLNNSNITLTSNNNTDNYQIDTSSINSSNISTNNSNLSVGRYYYTDNDGNTTYNSHQSVYLPKSVSKTITYKIKLKEKNIDRLTGDVITSTSNVINGGTKFYTEIDAPTGIYDIEIKIERGGVQNRINTSNSNTFNCEYSVQNILTSGGYLAANVVQESDGNDNYLTRPISLSKPFNTTPGENDRATNWVNDTYESTYITNTQDDINTKPMYEFTLTPQNISAIKQYNKNNAYSSWKFDNFIIENTNDTITNRKSNFLSCVIDNTNCEEIIDNSGSVINLENAVFNSNNENVQRISERSDKTGDWN